MRTHLEQPAPVSAAEVARSLGSWDQVVGYRESSSTPMPTSQRPSSAAGSAGSGSAGANAGATVAAVSAAGAGVANAARGVLDRLRRSGAGKGATVAPSAVQSAPPSTPPTQPGQAPAAPAPTEQSATTEEAAAPPAAPRESAPVPEPAAEETYVQVTGPTNPIPNVLSTASETVPGPAPVPAEPFTGSFPAFEDDDEEEEIDPAVARQEKRTTSSILVTLVLIVIVSLAAASYIVYQTIGIPFADKDQAAADTVPSATAHNAGGGGGQQQAPATEAPAAKPEIAGVSVANNLSTQADNNQKYLSDGDTSRPWFSHNTGSPELSQPIDIEIKLKSRAKVSEIDMQGTNEGGQVEVRATDINNAAGGTVLAQGPFAAGSTTLKVDNPQEVDTIVIRVMQLPKNSEPGEYPYKATMTEVTVK